MALKINSKAPDFRLQNAHERDFQLYNEIGGNGLALIFFPKAFSPGCTKEVCGFSEDISFYQKENIRLVGISHDSTDTLKRFQERHQLPFTLLSDPKRIVCRMYDAVYPFGLLTKRLTCYINPDKTIGHISDNLLNPYTHLEELKAFLLQRHRNRKAPAFENAAILPASLPPS